MQMLATSWARRPLTISTILALLASALLMVTLDRPVAELVYRELSPASLRFWGQVSDIAKSTVYIILFFLMYLGGRALFLWSAPAAIARWYADMARAGLFGLASYALSGAISHSLKFILARYRPKHLINDGEYGFSFLSGDYSYNSFPSGHSQSAFTAACVLSIMFPKASWLFLSAASLAAVCRVLSGAHFPSDILFGSYIGIMSVILIRRTWFPDVGAITPSSLSDATGSNGIVHGK